MPPAINMTDEEHGQLTVLGRAPNARSPNGNVRTMWRCRCVCGAEVDVRRSHLVAGDTTSCGCMRGVRPSRRRARTAAAATATTPHRVLRPVAPNRNVPPPGWTVEADRREEDTALWEITANRKAA